MKKYEEVVTVPLQQALIGEVAKKGILTSLVETGSRTHGHHLCI
jgi:hypothetical protein